MNQIIIAALESRWHELSIGLELTTPDNANGSNFTINAIENDSVGIVTNGGTRIRINRQAFVAVLELLIQNQHVLQNPCQIGADKDINQAGPLCVIARNANGVNVMIISYLLPLLAQMNLVQTNGNRPNSAWLV